MHKCFVGLGAIIFPAANSIYFYLRCVQSLSVDLKVPMFEMDTTIELVPTLQSLGIQAPFRQV